MKLSSLTDKTRSNNFSNKETDNEQNKYVRNNSIMVKYTTFDRENPDMGTQQTPVDDQITGDSGLSSITHDTTISPDTDSVKVDHDKKNVVLNSPNFSSDEFNELSPTDSLSINLDKSDELSPLTDSLSINLDKSDDIIISTSKNLEKYIDDLENDPRRARTKSPMLRLTNSEEEDDNKIMNSDYLENSFNPIQNSFNPFMKENTDSFKVSNTNIKENSFVISEISSENDMGNNLKKDQNNIDKLDS